MAQKAAAPTSAEYSSQKKKNKKKYWTKKKRKKLEETHLIYDWHDTRWLGMKPHKRFMIFSFIFLPQRNPFQHPVCLLLFVVAVSCATHQEPPPPRGLKNKTKNWRKKHLSKWSPQRVNMCWRGEGGHYAHTYAYEKYVTQDGARAHNEIPRTHKIC